MIITVISGKGGAGKTTVTAALAHTLPGERTILVDADVDTPNLSLALGLGTPTKKEDWYGGIVAEWTGGSPDPSICPFGAIKEDGTVNELLCEGCGVCARRKPESYRLKNVKTAEILEYRWRDIPLITAELEPGRSGSGKIVTEIRNRADRLGKEEDRDIQLIDAAAGRGCPVIASVRGADLAILVVDNSLTSVSDAQAVAQILNHFGIPFLFVVNRADLAPERIPEIVERFERSGGKHIGTIPYEEEILKTYPTPAERVIKHIKVEEILRML